MKKHFQGLTKNTFLLTITSLFADISTEMLYPVLPIFLTQYLKSSGSMVGIIEGVATATQYIQMGVSGWISDKIKRRKPIAIIGYTLAALSKPLIGLSTAWTGVLGARFMDRLGTGTRSAPRYALVAESASEKDRGKAFGLEGLGDNLGAFLGPLLAIVLIFYFKIELRHIFLLAVIPGSIAVGMIFLVKEEKQKVKVKYKISANIKELPHKYWKYLATIAIFGIGNLSSSFLILQIRNAGVPLIYTILIYAFFNLVAAAVSYPLGSLSDKLGRKKILLFSFVVFLISLLGFAVTKNIFIFAFLFALYGVYQGIFRAVGNAFASDFVPENMEATAIGWFNATVGLSSLVASITAGLVYDKIGHPAVFLIASAFVGLGSLMLLFF